MGGDLINLGNLTKPATVLIERVSDAVGGIAKPWQTRRVAQAESDAEVIRAEAQIKISELQRRAIERMIREEGRNQENIESITAKAAPLLTEDSQPQNIETDWLTHFFERSRITSDEEMQKLWANILAGEANAPGRFSKRSIELIAILSKADAMLFTKLCSYRFQFAGRDACIAYHSTSRPYQDFELTFDDLTQLDSLGLISFDPVSGYVFQKLPRKVKFEYFGKSIDVELPLHDPHWPTLTDKPKVDGEFIVSVGDVFFTQAGAELASVCGAGARSEALDAVLAKWLEQGYVLSSPLKDSELGSE